MTAWHDRRLMPAALRVLHLIERLTSGGAARSLVTAAAYSHRHAGTHHRLVSLRPSDAFALRRADAAGITLADVEDLDREITACDVVNIHFWNTPQLDAAVHRPWPPCRILLTSHVSGLTPPHVLTDALVDLADMVIATTPETLAADAPATRARRIAMIPEVADFDRLGAIRPMPHAGFAIGYIGTVDFAKMHPDYVAMHAALDLPEARIVVCGQGAAEQPLRTAIAALGAEDRFDLRGHVEDVGAVLAGLDVFGYPLCDGNFATTELVLHEAMFAGLPCVVLANGGAAHTVIDGVTGFVVADAGEYRARLRQLHDDPALRRSMGAEAAAHARAHFGPAHLAPRIEAAYAALAALPRTARDGHPTASGVRAFLRSLGHQAGPFHASLAGDDEADAAILQSPPVLASADTGGVLHYRRFYPDDPPLRFWAGLVLLGLHRPALAAGEFKQAAAMGFDPARSLAWLERAMRAAGSVSPASRATPHQ